MARAEANKLYTNFTKGLITEASPLAYPENSTLDEDNCLIKTNGDRTRRYGFNSNDQTTDFTPIGPSTVSQTAVVYSHVWKTVANDPDVDFLVTFSGGVVRFDLIYVISELSFFDRKSFTIDLSAYKLSTSSASDVDNNFVGFASGKGELFITNKHMDPLRVVYDPNTDTIAISVISIQVRDHYGIEDGLAVDEEPTTLSAAHHYNLLNQGWEYAAGGVTSGAGQARRGFTILDDETSYIFPTYQPDNTTVYASGPIGVYFASRARYPSNNKVWWAGKNAEGTFDPALLEKTYFGNTRAPRGHFVIDAFTKDRSDVSGVNTVPTTPILTRPDSICFASGRIFFGHESTIFMSPVLETTARVGQCYQEADPTSEDISDLIPTDGGFIEIPDADHIISLKPLADGIVVVAKNGVWFINSGGQGFTALDYTINKITDVGCQARESVVIAGDTMFWWTKQGIQAIQPATGQFGAIPGQFTQQNITEQTIKSFYTQINEFAKPFTKAVFDPVTNKIYWLYRVDNTKTRKLLIYDLNFQAFIPQSMNCEQLIAVDMFIDQYYTKSTQEDTFVKFLALEKRWVGGGTQAYRQYLTTAQFIDFTYVDGRYATENHEAPAEAGPAIPVVNYETYLETGYEVMQDGLRKKQVPFLGVFFRQNGDDAACSLTVKWSWSRTEASNKWSTPVYAYRPKKNYWRTEAENLADMQTYEIIYTRNKVRGSGRAIQFRFSEARENYGFTIIGWHAFYQGNTVP